MSDCITIPLTQGKSAVIDAEDAERVCAYKWTALRSDSQRPKWFAIRQDYSLGYGVQRMIYLHRFLMDAPEDMQVDHRNGDSLDCRKENLRLATAFQNSCNVPPRRGPTRTSQFKGVSRRNGKWLAILQAQGVRFRAGLFVDEAEAARAYDKLAREHHGEFAWLNFPEEDDLRARPRTAESAVR